MFLHIIPWYHSSQEDPMHQPIQLGTTQLKSHRDAPAGDYVNELSRRWYRIHHYDRMAPFLVSVINPDDIWMYLSTTGGITAGRRSRDSAFFPYTTVDKVTDSHGDTGGYTSILVSRGHESFLWMPLQWSTPSVYDRERAFLKSATGDAVLFSETNRTLGLEFRVGWEASPRYGIHRFCSLQNTSDTAVSVRIMDGLRNILPSGIPPKMQASFSNLVDAYKRSERDPDTDLGIYSLSATPTDAAEAAECLRATTVWSYGLEGAEVLLSEGQIDTFRAGEAVSSETDTQGRRGAYLLVGERDLEPGTAFDWGFCGEVDQSHTAVIDLQQRLAHDRAGVVADLQSDLSRARDRIESILVANDGVQEVGSEASRHHHAANVIFNVMRGGFFVAGYEIDTAEFARFVGRWNAGARTTMDRLRAELPQRLAIDDLRRKCAATGDPVLRRLAWEYLPLTFSRRHGDPSRPWNEFFIRTNGPDGQPLIGYQGNWRDIFQNWEALCLSYPEFLPSVVVKFLNATTADGYNPYRISQDGIDWEVPEPGNAWSNIGYWGDHQIVYLSRLMEHLEHFSPGTLGNLLNDPFFVCADVPYRIRPFDRLVVDPRDAIVFDEEKDRRLRQRIAESGSDGALLAVAVNGEHEPLRMTLMEKLLILLLAKSANHVHGGGIWLNTQRPEWNDANNALAGWGLSVVTASYLVRFVALVREILAARDGSASEGAESAGGAFPVHSEVGAWFARTLDVLRTAPAEAEQITPAERYRLLRAVGSVASEYRDGLYRDGLSGTTTLSRSAIEEYLTLLQEQLSTTVETSRRPDGCFESYQLLEITGGSGVDRADGSAPEGSPEAHIRTLYPMLEGQVAGISSGLLSAEAVIAVLDGLRRGPLYRTDQNSYMLYPRRELPGFLGKNSVSDADVSSLAITRRPRQEWAHILTQDSIGTWHFGPGLKSARDLVRETAPFDDGEREELLDLFERTFDHAAFTGRSGTFFAYEGLGSIYWHMVSKLLLAVQEQLIGAVLGGKPTETVRALKERYLDIRAGLGFNKRHDVYGAVPTDPYSHTPWGHGAKQPGMTGQVKEEIVARFGELGLIVLEGRIRFLPELILDDQWLEESASFRFAFCGAPVTVVRGTSPGLVIGLNGGEKVELTTLTVPREYSEAIFRRSGRVVEIHVTVT
jgi:hypothetical protein